jgi:hypothetical protein
MAKSKRSRLSVTADEAQKALNFLVHEGKLTAKTVQKALQRREKLVREVRDRLTALGESAVGLGVSATRAAGAALSRAEKVPRKPRRKAVSAAVKEGRRLQGQYMSAVRRLSKEAKKQVKAIREKSGVKAATAAAKKIAR